MANQAHNALLQGMGVVHDALRDVWMPPALVITLLRISATANAFESVYELADKWFFEYIRVRQQFKFEIAVDDESLTEAIGLATHIALDNDIYTIANGDTVPPIGMDVTWKLFCTRFHGAANYSVLR